MSSGDRSCFQKTHQWKIPNWMALWTYLGSMNPWTCPRTCFVVSESVALEEGAGICMYVFVCMSKLLDKVPRKILKWSWKGNEIRQDGVTPWGATAVVAFQVLLWILCATPSKALNLFVPSLTQPFGRGSIWGSISKASDSWSQGQEVEPSFGHRA